MSDALPPVLLAYQFDMWPIFTQCTLNFTKQLDLTHLQAALITSFVKSVS